MASGVTVRRRIDAVMSPPFALLLVAALALVASVPRVSDIRLQRLYEIGAILPFEHPVLARAVYIALRAVAGGPDAIAVVAAVVGVGAAVAVALLLRRAGADVAVWTTAPTIVLVGQNLDAITCVLIVLGLSAWQRSRAPASGMWLGLGAAFKVTPAILVPPLAASDVRTWRRVVLLVVAAAGTWALFNVPYAIADYDRWAFPYRFARLRDDVAGTVWAAVPFGIDTVNLLSTLLLVAGVLGVSLAVVTGRVAAAPGAALSIVVFLATNKVWQPHYVLWLLAVVAFIPRLPRRPLRTLEVANLGYFAVYWLDVSDTAKAPWMWLTGGARLIALAWLMLLLLRAGRPT